MPLPSSPKPGRPTPGSRPRFELFNSLRAIAAVSVLVYHASFYSPGLKGSFANYFNQRTTGFPTEGVVMFFAISGFLLYRPFAQARFDGVPGPSLWPYAARRLLRIVPAYWLALIAVAIVLGLDGVFTLHGVGTYFGFLQVYDVRTLDGGMGQAWTLDVELTFYAGLVVLALGLRRFALRRTNSFVVSELARAPRAVARRRSRWQIAWIHWSSDAVDPLLPGADLAARLGRPVCRRDRARRAQRRARRARLAGRAPDRPGAVDAMARRGGLLLAARPRDDSSSAAPRRSSAG